MDKNTKTSLSLPSILYWYIKKKNLILRTMEIYLVEGEIFSCLKFMFWLYSQCGVPVEWQKVSLF